EQFSGRRAHHEERLPLLGDSTSTQGQRIQERSGTEWGAKVSGIHDLERCRANPADRRKGSTEVQGANPETHESDARRQRIATHHAVGAIPDRLARLLRLLPDPDRGAAPGRLDSSPITHVYLATMEEWADPVRAIASPACVPLPRGHRCWGKVWVLEHGSPCDGTASPAQRLLRLDRPPSVGGIAGHVIRPNRRGTAPYARWCGRGGAARLPPIPMNPGTRSPAARGRALEYGERFATSERGAGSGGRRGAVEGLRATVD